MASVLDTDVVSQRIKDKPNEAVVRWFKEIAETEMYLSVISLQEIRLGIEMMPPGRKRDRLETWLTVDLRRSFAHRLLGVDDKIADEAARMIATVRKAGAEAGMGDALIAATAKVHGFKVATLNRNHFRSFGVSVVEF